MKENNNMNLLKKVLCILVFIFFAGCSQTNTSETKMTIRVSNHYSSKEIETGIKLVMGEFQKHFRGCTLYAIYNDENMYSLKERQHYIDKNKVKQLMVIQTHFQTGHYNVGYGLTKNTKYENYQWILIKDHNNKWSIRDCGYKNKVK